MCIKYVLAGGTNALRKCCRYVVLHLAYYSPLLSHVICSLTLSLICSRRISSYQVSENAFNLLFDVVSEAPNLPLHLLLPLYVYHDNKR